MLSVKVVANGFETEVKSLQELFDEIKQYDPDVDLHIVFTYKGPTFEETVSATVDP